MKYITYRSFIIFILLFILLECCSNRIYVIISSCTKDRKQKINSNYIPYKVITLFCNRSTNQIDSLEAGLMLDFIIQRYNKHGKYKYIFIHDHVNSWHQRESIYRRLNYLKNTKYINIVKFGGLNCLYLQFGNNMSYERMFNSTYEIDKYMRNNSYNYLSLLQLYTQKYIFPCCATFVVDISRIIQHPLSFYINLRKGLRQYVLKSRRNKLSANYMEYMWSIIFGLKDVEYPPDCNYSTIIWKRV